MHYLTYIFSQKRKILCIFVFIFLFIAYYVSLLYIITFVHLLYKNIYCFFLSQKNVNTQIKFDSGTTHLPYNHLIKLFMNIEYV